MWRVQAGSLSKFAKISSTVENIIFSSLSKAKSVIFLISLNSIKLHSKLSATK